MATKKATKGKSGKEGQSRTEAPVDKADLYEHRLEKLENMQEQGINPYNASFARTSLAGPALETKEEDFAKVGTLQIGGRVRSRRMMGKAGFTDIEDESGRIQIYAARDALAKDFETFSSLDLGDIIGVHGTLFKTKTGQTSLRVTELQLLAKCLRPLPVVKEADGKVFDTFTDKEQRYRMRYVDLIVNPDVRQSFIMRSKLIAYIRSFLMERDYLEVETPMMQTIPGGASARPFATHHNALGLDLYLRIAPELYLKRLIVGGFGKVFELNRNFRNEGISFKHNPEFTMLELYEAYGDMNSMLQLCEQLISGAALHICGNTKITYEGTEIDLTPPWDRMTYLESVEKHSGARFHADMSLDEARAEAVRVGIAPEVAAECASVWKAAEAVFDEKTERELIQPVFITHFPKELSPLAKAWPEDPNFVERFEPYVVGRELGNAFSELNDPVDQKARFEEQVRERVEGEGEGGYMDHDYVRALEYGMPPAGGLGIGIDRLAMLLNDLHSIKDTILFPLLRPEKKADQSESVE